MKETEDAYTAFENGATLKDTTNRLMEIVFLNRAIYSLQRLKEDDFSEFLVFLAERLEAIVLHYDKNLAKFDTYFTQAVMQIFFWWKKRCESEHEKQTFSQTLIDEYNYDIIYRYNCEENSLSLELSEENVSLEKLKECAKNLSYQVRRRAIHKPLGGNSNYENSALTCLVLALKSCRQINEEMIEKISKIANISKNKLENLLEEAKKSIKKKEERINLLVSRRNSAYLARRKSIFRQKKIKNLYPESRDACCFSLHDGRWKETILQISKLSETFSPSNVTVARLLGISSRQVAQILKSAQQNVDKIAPMCYPSSYENLLGNGKLGQETGIHRTFPRAYRGNSKR